MRILPVIDLLRGEAVHGRAGQRASYRPVESRLVTGSDPILLATAYRDQLGCDEVYVADLDALTGSTPRDDLWLAIDQLGLRLWLDAGIDGFPRATALRQFASRCAHPPMIIVALESVGSVSVVTALLDAVGPLQLVVSLDVEHGRPLARASEWLGKSLLEVATSCADLGVQRMILLDLKRVGMNRGTGTREMLRQLAEAHPDLEWLCGGGIASVEDARQLQADGADGVLLASTLHDGRIGAAELRALRRL